MGRIRDAWNVLRGYAAGSGQPCLNLGGLRQQRLRRGQRRRPPPVASRARGAVRNAPYAARIVDLWAGDPVGAGIGLSPLKWSALE